MNTTNNQDISLAVQEPVPYQFVSRRNWLALLGTRVLAVAPTAVFAGPINSTGEALPAAALAGGDEYIGIVKLLAGTTPPVR